MISHLKRMRKTRQIGDGKIKEEIKILTPAGMLGYGFPIDLFQKGVEMNPDVIVIDSGSTDSGPHKLGLGSMTCSRQAYYKDLSIMLEAGYEKKIPIFISRRVEMVRMTM